MFQICVRMTDKNNMYNIFNYIALLNSWLTMGIVDCKA